MKKSVKHLIFWTPRILCILFIAFVSLFALDVFNEHYGFWKTILALSMHLIPTFIMIIILILSWRWEWIGGILFNVLGVLYLIMSWGNIYFVLYIPLFLTGTLFLISWVYRIKK